MRGTNWNSSEVLKSMLISPLVCIWCLDDSRVQLKPACVDLAVTLTCCASVAWRHDNSSCGVMVMSLPCSGNFPMISDDLVNSYHLLLCALDLVFTNALLCNARKDLLNPSFRGTSLCTSVNILRPHNIWSSEDLIRVALALKQKETPSHFKLLPAH